jgi:hypothetical protein
MSKSPVYGKTGKLIIGRNALIVAFSRADFQNVWNRQAQIAVIGR